ncbi:MAG: penicillin-binding protein 1A [Methylococcaceae bacterium]|nr:penicillin-binding protein 1A [Methylococcaceae bacterium]
MTRLCIQLLKWLSIFFLLICAIATISGYFIYTRLMLDLPDVKTLRHAQYQIPLSVYSKENLLIAQYGEKKRIPISIEQIPKQLVFAFLAAEDDGFYEHPGIDIKGLMRAAYQLALTGKKKQGGSTITMQVTRNFLLSNEKTYSRKLKEIVLALKIEQEYSKDQILELYLNQIFMGHRAYGVAAAAQVYYGKTLNSLTLAEHAMIAGLPKAPSTYNPITNEERALQRRNYVLQRMLELNRISQKDYENAIRQPSTAKLQTVIPELSAPHLAEMVRQKIYEDYGEQAYTSGLKVYTTIDGNLQAAANNALANTLHAYDERHGYRSPTTKTSGKYTNFSDIPIIGDTLPGYVVSLKHDTAKVRLQDHEIIDLQWDNCKWAGNRLENILKVGSFIRVRKLKGEAWRLTQVPETEGAFVALSPSNGAIIALTGGFDFTRNKYNRAIQSKRQPGSGFKPIIYTTALEEGFTPASMINDAPLVIDIPGQETEWRPENYNRKFLGPTSLRNALVHSRNIISIRLLKEIGIEKTVKTALRFGFTEEQLPKTLSLALGSGHATPTEMARLYATFANGGFLVDPYFIERIETVEGNTIYQARPKIACPNCETTRMQSGYAPRVVAPDINFLMNSMLRDVVQKGTATAAKSLGRQDLAGKTGTTNEQRDAWFNGYTPTIVATAWLGFDDFSPLGDHETGGTAALPMWIEFMQTALKYTREVPVEEPVGIVKAYINPKTGLLVPEKSIGGIWEFFQAAHVPNTFSKSQSENRPENFAPSEALEELF